MNPKIIFFVLLILSASGFISPPIALSAGIVFGLSLPHPYSADSKSLSKFLLQASIVALGFGMNLHEVLKAGRSGFLYTAIGITFAMFAGLLIGKLLAVRGTTSYLISTGTAICGGSAIAAVGPVLNASEEEMAVSLGTVFILNSIALLIFPVIGKSLALSQSQFGLWAALAIHDTSSVVGAASRYGTEALIIATTVKLARALWIVPLAFFTAAVKHGKSKVTIPWFILFFFLAAVINTFGPQDAVLSQKFFTLGKLGLTATLFLIGTSISRATLKEVGWRPLAQGIVLWLIVGSLSLYFIHTGWISISATF
ncbi:MAG: putative sulfate exporter family transporter [Acidobacteria bacterium]|nr:putative sulfate exporter family transporter [Acidobacteriota bacterium]MBS1867114.1 putative sulfate exporter family transporter [Acidobacteriota bacterium]